MRQFLIDTDVIIDAGRKKEYALTLFNFIEENGEPNVSIVSAMELLVGCRSKTEVRYLQSYLSEFTILQINEVISEKAFALLQQYKHSHGLLIPDAVIASTSLVYSIPLVTNNQKDYRFIKEIELFRLPQ